MVRIGEVIEGVNNLSFSLAGVKSFTVNISNYDLTQAGSNNYTFNVSGFASLAANVNHNENFTSNASINTTSNVNTTVPVGVFDNFEINNSNPERYLFTRSGQWAGCNDNDGNSSGNVDDYYELSCRGPGGLSISATKTLYTPVFDLRNVSFFRVNHTLDLDCAGSSSIDTCTSEYKLGVYDGSTFFEFEGLTKNKGQIFTGNRNVSGVKLNEDTWTIFVNEESPVNKTITLNDNNPWYLGWFANLNVIKNINDAVQRDVNVTINHIELGGVINNLTEVYNGSEYSVFSSFVSSQLNESEAVIPSATIESVSNLSKGWDSIPTFSYFLSNDDGVTWVSATVGTPVRFATSGSELRYKIECSSDNVTPCLLSDDLLVTVVNTNVENLSVDFGSDGVFDYFVSGVIDDTSGSIRISNGSDALINYAFNNCVGATTCAVPVSLGSATAGVVQVEGSNFTRDFGRFFMTTDDLENVSNVTLLANFSGGSVNVTELEVDFWGNKRINITANISNGSEYLFADMRYSRFNLSFPDNVSFFQFFAKSREDKNLTPDGQTNSTPLRNVSNDAYDNGINISIWLNESIGEDVNVSVNNSPFLPGLLINTSGQQVCNIVEGSSCGLWFWVDLNITGSLFFNPVFWISAICEDCVQTFDRFENKIKI